MRAAQRPEELPFLRAELGSSQRALTHKCLFIVKRVRLRCCSGMRERLEPWRHGGVFNAEQSFAQMQCAREPWQRTLDERSGGGLRDGRGGQ